MERSERGLTLVETLVALLLLGFALLMAASVVAWGQRVEARIERRAVALDIAEGVLESLRRSSHASVRPSVDDVADELGSVLPEGVVELLVEDDDDLALKRVTVLVSWRGRDPGVLRLSTAVGATGIYR